MGEVQGCGFLIVICLLVLGAFCAVTGAGNGVILAIIFLLIGALLLLTKVSE